MHEVMIFSLQIQTPWVRRLGNLARITFLVIKRVLRFKPSSLNLDLIDLNNIFSTMLYSFIGLFLS